MPPLHSPENYGQFGFLLICFGFFGLFYGASFGLIPYTRFVLWLPAFILLTLAIGACGDLAATFDAIEVTCSAMIVVGGLIVFLAFLTSAAIRRLEYRTTR